MNERRNRLYVIYCRKRDLSWKGWKMPNKIIMGLEYDPSLSAESIVASMVHSRDDIVKLLIAIKLSTHQNELGVEAHLMINKLRERVRYWPSPVRATDLQELQSGLNELYWLCESCCDAYFEELAKAMVFALSIACEEMMPASEAPETD